MFYIFGGVPPRSKVIVIIRSYSIYFTLRGFNFLRSAYSLNLTRGLGHLRGPLVHSKTNSLLPSRAAVTPGFGFIIRASGLS